MAENLSLVTFKISSELYGIDIMDVMEIIRLCEITPIPNSPDFIDGVINLRGDIIPIVDLKKRFNFDEKTFTEEEELLRGIIIILVNDLRIGIIIDQVYKVINIYREEIKPPPQMITGIGAEYIQGVVKLEEDDILLILLNIKKLFSKKELLQMMV
ncbi:MAG: purine-binding chemotaxis protein CheW [Spirochaetes bacterium]|nr:purine-binding chemotaxis protein CheW [Spirochaetota bacterium]